MENIIEGKLFHHLGFPYCLASVFMTMVFIYLKRLFFYKRFQWLQTLYCYHESLYCLSLTTKY